MASILYLGTDEGVVTLKSEDGRSWKIEHHGLKDWQVPEVAVSPSAPNKVFAGTRGDGVWLSEDFGKTWLKPNRGKPGPGKVRCLTIAPDNTNRLYAGCEPIDVFMSEDLGKNWNRGHSVWDDPYIDAEIVGVVGDVKHGGLDSLSRPNVYFAASQFPWNTMTFVVRRCFQCSAGKL